MIGNRELVDNVGGWQRQWPIRAADLVYQFTVPHHFSIYLKITHSPWRWRFHVPPKHWNQLTSLYAVITQECVTWEFFLPLRKFVHINVVRRKDWLTSRVIKNTLPGHICYSNIKTNFSVWNYSFYLTENYDEGPPNSWWRQSPGVPNSPLNGKMSS